MKPGEKDKDGQKAEAAAYLDLWEKNLALLATRGMALPEKADKD